MNKLELLGNLKSYGFPKHILNAFYSVKREHFVSPELEKKAYEDTPLPIGNGQTISQPYTIAVMLSELNLKPKQKVLEIGSGSGYVLALISNIIGRQGEVTGFEIIKSLANKSKKVLREYENVRVYNKNGIDSLEEKTLFDRILISAACREIPESILNHLKNNGILVAPQGSRFEQELVVIQKKGKEFITKSRIPGFVFVPLVGEN